MTRIMSTFLSQFKILEKISENMNSEVYLAVNKNQEKVIIKKLLNFSNNNKDNLIFRVKREADILKNYFHNHSVKLLDILEDRDFIYLIMEYYEAKNLKQVYSKMSFHQKILTFYQTVCALDEIHKKDIVHRDLKPENILVKLHPEIQIKIIDFGLAYIKNLSDVFKKGSIIGTLFYLSPEQTGLLKRSIDNRTDLYSLGATFYLIFSDRLPFEETDPLKLIHSHLSVTPKSPSFYNHEIPFVLDNILLKLLSKEPGERYQSAHGLKEDLKKLIENPAVNFQIALQDNETRLNLNGKTIGRENEIKQIEKIYQETLKKKIRTLVLRGKSGLGKTKTIEGFKETLDFRKTFYFGVNCSKDIQNIPFFIFKEFFEKLLLENSKISLTQFMQEKLKDDFYILKTLFPFIDTQNKNSTAINEQEKKELKPEEVFEAIKNFILLFREKSQNFVFFIDDIQWSDSASLELISFLTKKMKDISFYFLCTVREEEQDEAYFQNNPEFFLLDLKELDKNTLPLLVKSILNQNCVLSPEFYDKIYRDSLGNTFYIIEMLKALQEENILVYSSSFAWRINEDLFEKYHFKQDVSSFIFNRIEKLDPKTKIVLETASVIGKDFSLNLLKEVLNEQNLNFEFSELLSILENAKKKQILEENLSKDSDNFFFIHDKIIEGLQKNLAPEKLIQLHLLCAKSLEKKSDPNLFYPLAYHYNYTNQKEKKIFYNTLSYQHALNQFSLKEAVYYMEKISEEYLKNNLSEKEIAFIIETATVMQQAGYLEKSRDFLFLIFELVKKKYTVSMQINITLLIGSSYLYQNQLPLAVQYYKEAIEKAEKTNMEIKIWQPYFQLANTYFFKSEFNLSVQYFSKALEYIPKEDNENILLSIALRLYSYYFLGEIGKAEPDLKYLEKNIQFISNPIYLSRFYHTLALCYNWKGFHEKALDYSLKSYKEAEKSGLVVMTYSSLFSGLLSYFFMEDFDKMNTTFEKALEISDKHNVSIIIESYWSFSAFADIIQKKFIQADQTINRFLPKVKNIENKFAEVLFKYLKACSCYCKNNLESAKQHLDEAYSLCCERQLDIAAPWILLLYKKILEIRKENELLVPIQKHMNFLFENKKELSFMFSHAEKIIHILEINRLEKEMDSSVSMFKEKLQLENVVKTSQMISSVLNIDTLLNLILQSMLETTGAQRGILKLTPYQQQEDFYIFKNIQQEENDFDFIQSILVETEKNKKGFIIENELMKEKSILSIISSPMIIKGNLIGVVYLDSKVLENLFTEEELNLLNIFTTQAAISIENARAYEELKVERNSLEIKVKERTKELEDKNKIIQSKNHQMREDLKLAQKIQNGLIPSIHPIIDGVQIASFYKPMEDIGGDFYDFLSMKNPDLTGIFISDVSGHGVPAALITTMIKTLIETSEAHRNKPSSLLSYINQKIMGQMGGNFLTAFYGIYDSAKKTLSYAKAAHNPPFLIRDGEIISLDSKGKMIGVFSNISFEEKEISLKSGDKVLFYTDGLTEAANEEGIEFEETLCEILIFHSRLSVDELLERIYHRLLIFQKDLHFEDDICMVLFGVL